MHFKGFLPNEILPGSKEKTYLEVGGKRPTSLWLLEDKQGRSVATMKVEVGAKRPHFLTCAFEDFRLTCMGCFCNTCKRAVARLDSILPQRSSVPRSCEPMRDSTDPMCFCVTGSNDDTPYRHVQWTYRVASARSGLLSCPWELHAACKCCRQKS